MSVIYIYAHKPLPRSPLSVSCVPRTITWRYQNMFTWPLVYEMIGRQNGSLFLPGLLLKICRNLKAFIYNIYSECVVNGFKYYGQCVLRNISNVLPCLVYKDSRNMLLTKTYVSRYIVILKISFSSNSLYGKLI